MYKRQLQTYTKARVSDTYKIRGVSDSNYEEFAGGVLKYSREDVYKRQVKNKINVFENIINNNLIENFLKYEEM